MCNIAGYIGNKNAAPILCAMMKKQEGFGGGYYTGITTHDGTNMHSTKVIGNLNNLLEETDAFSFPGHVGFLHSRSKSGGGVEWGQPFLSGDGELSFIANGTFGVFNNEQSKKRRCDRALLLESLGYDFKSRAVGAIGDYPLLSDGTAIHASDILCQDIAHNISSGLTVDAAMSKTFSEMPIEAVGVVIYRKNPDSIFVTRVNFPMMIGIANDGDTYIATTALAFPDDVEFRLIHPLPPCCTCEVFQGGYKVSPYPVAINGVAEITPSIWRHAYDRIYSALQSAEKSSYAVQELIDLCEPVWPANKIAQGAMLIYEVLRALHIDGKLGIEYVEDEGTFENYSTMNYRVYLNG